MAERERSSGFLSRWSDRKVRAREEDRTPPPADVSDNVVPEPAPAVEMDPAEAAQAAIRSANHEAAAAVDIGSMNAESDFAMFLRDGVPQDLRRAALRQLFAVKPALANLDGLVDYGDDFGAKALLRPQMKSGWKAGRGYIKRVLDESGSEAPPEPLDAGQPADDALLPAAPAAETTPEDFDPTFVEAIEPAEAETVETREPEAEPAPVGRTSLRARHGIASR